MMKNIGLIFPFLKLCFTNTGEVFKTLYNFTLETKFRNYVQRKYGMEKGLPVIDLLELFPDFTATVENYTYLVGTARTTDIALLKLLAGRYGRCSFIEFGTLRGESISNVAAVADECVSVSFSEEEMRAFGVDEHSIKVTRMFTSEAGNIRHIEHNTQTYDFSELEGKFDLVFIDADHKYEGVKIDARNAFRLLRNEKSVIVWHDYGRTFEGINWQVFAGILDGCPSDEHRNSVYRVSNTICAIYTNEDFKAGYPEPRVPNKTFTVNLSASPLAR